jgi:hypothetical protein
VNEGRKRRMEEGRREKKEEGPSSLDLSIAVVQSPGS